MGGLEHVVVRGLTAIRQAKDLQSFPRLRAILETESVLFDYPCTAALSHAVFDQFGLGRNCSRILRPKVPRM